MPSEVNPNESEKPFSKRWKFNLNLNEANPRHFFDQYLSACSLQIESDSIRNRSCEMFLIKFLRESSLESIRLNPALIRESFFKTSEFVFALGSQSRRIQTIILIRSNPHVHSKFNPNLNESIPRHVFDPYLSACPLQIQSDWIRNRSYELFRIKFIRESSLESIRSNPALIWIFRIRF